MICLYIVEKVLPSQKYTVRKNDSIKIQTLNRVRLRNFTTRTPLEESYTIAKFRTDDDIVTHQEYLYRIAWDEKSNYLILDQPNLCCDPVTIEHANIGDLVNQQNDDKKFPNEHKNELDSIHEALKPQKHTRVKIMSTVQKLKQAEQMMLVMKLMVPQTNVTIEFYDMTQIYRHLQKLVSLPIKTMKLLKTKSPHVGVNTNYDLTLNQTSQTHMDIGQVPSTHITKQTPKSPNFSFLFSIMFFFRLYWNKTNHNYIGTAHSSLEATMKIKNWRIQFTKQMDLSPLKIYL